MTINKRKPITNEDLARLMQKHFNVIDKRFDVIDIRFKAVDKRFDVIEKRFKSIDKRFAGIDNRLDSVCGRLGKLEVGQTKIQAQLTSIFFVQKNYIDDITNLQKKSKNYVTYSHLKSILNKT